MIVLTREILFDAALRVQLLGRSLEISFTSGGFPTFRFPNTRKLADFLGIPHYLILQSFAEMENEELVIRAERVGIVTTPAGSRLMISVLKGKYRNEAESILGIQLLAELIRSCNVG